MFCLQKYTKLTGDNNLNIYLCLNLMCSIRNNKVTRILQNVHKYVCRREKIYIYIKYRIIMYI